MAHLCTLHLECSMCCLRNKFPSTLSTDSAPLLSGKDAFFKKPKSVYHGFFSHQHLKLPSSSSAFFSSFSASLSPLKFIAFCTISDSEPEESRIKSCNSSSSTTRKSVRKRAPKITDEALLEDLHHFLSSQGLPLDKIPSTKELVNRGREDLAKIVRRRGYKAMNELLNKNLKVGPAPTNEDGIKISPHSSQDALIISTDVDIEQSKRVANSDVFGQETDPVCLSQRTIENRQDALLKTEIETPYSLNGSLMGRKVDESLHQRAAAEFVKPGQLNCRQAIPTEEEEEEEEKEDDDLYEDSSDEEEDREVHNGESSAGVIAFEKAAKLRAKLLPFLKMNVSKKDNDHHDNLVQEKTGTENVTMTNIGTRFSIIEAEIELQRIKSDLRDKERELAEMSRELEETKAQLALVQAKAAVEVAQAQQVVLEKDIRLRSADRALASLKQVQVEYWGEGSTVELAGSFNGWKHFVVMKPDLTSEISKPDGSRGPLMWETELWLYPGLYEIKFIVDGNWQIDERREIVMRNELHNNILRVDP